MEKSNIHSLIITIIIVILFILSIFKGESRRYYLSEDDKSWNPYKMGDVLVYEFSGNDHERDTLYITEVKEKFYYDTPIPLPFYEETLEVVYKKQKGYPFTLLTLYAATPKRKTSLSFNLELGKKYVKNVEYKNNTVIVGTTENKNYAWFIYDFSNNQGILIDTLINYPLQSLKLKKINIDDIVIIHSKIESDLIEHMNIKEKDTTRITVRDMFINKHYYTPILYWSKSQGYIKLIREDGQYWELIDKYNIQDKKNE